MKDRPPFWPGDATTPPPPSSDPLKLISFALSAKIPIQMVDLAGSVHSIEFERKKPKSGTCHHQLAWSAGQGQGQGLSAFCPLCEKVHPAWNICAACGEHVPYHDFPTHALRVAVVSIQAPIDVGKNLQSAPGEQDAYILIRVPRAAIDAMDSPIAVPTPSLIIRPF